MASQTPDPVWPLTYHALADGGAGHLWLTFGNFLMKSDSGGAGQWEPVPTSDTGGPILYALAYAPSDGLFAAGRGVFRKSLDGGETWEPVGQLADAEVKGLAVLPGAGAILALVHDRGLLKSEDGGATWEAVSTDVPASAFGLWVVSEDPLRMYSLQRTDRSVLVSEDGGATWSGTTPQGLEGELWSAAVASDGTAYAATGEGLFASSDGGMTWLERGDRDALVAVAPSRDDPSRILAIDHQGQVFGSADGGRSF